jgi:hypothetical protein
LTRKGNQFNASSLGDMKYRLIQENTALFSLLGFAIKTLGFLVATPTLLVGKDPSFIKVNYFVSTTWIFIFTRSWRSLC